VQSPSSAFPGFVLGNDQEPAAVDKLADDLIREYPREGFADELAKAHTRDWAEESVQSA
jgi:hypothetical protein